MSLSHAHEGYEYQDLLTCYFILEDLLSEGNSKFTIDTKEFDEDKIDDLTISSPSVIKKIQVKYSRDANKHTLEKKDISTITGYNLAIDSLFTSWMQHPEKSRCKLRLCLAWNEPIDEIKDVLVKDPQDKSFKYYPTEVYKIDADNIWPLASGPLANWKRLKNIEATTDRNEFVDFCSRFLIEVNLPKFSLNVHQPLDLEYIVLQQITELGIGVFPNENKSKEEFVLQLTQIVKQARSGLLTGLDTALILKKLDIRQDYGAIYQDFPVVQEELIVADNFNTVLHNELINLGRVILLGEPGSGKSWFLKGFEEYLITTGSKIVKHLCYTDLNDPMQKDRIQTNVFYGNLIAEILQFFPKLKITKPQKFASTLAELNHLLGLIDEPTVLIIDGLDHIERIKNYYKYNDLAQSQVEIILRLNELVISPFVEILVTSQPVPDLSKISDFKEVYLPAWTKTETALLMSKKRLENIEFGEQTLIDLVFNKAKGNPLYTNYLIAECLRIDNITEVSISHLPEYSFNISRYYEYLFTNIKLNENVPQILSGVSFPLTKNEIVEITGLGDIVEESLSVIAPVLKQSLAQSGYKIYHESFKRFVFDQLKAKNIVLQKVIVQPVSDWFESKSVLTHPKAYRYFFTFLADYNDYQRILPYANKDFIVDSLFNGQSWDLIKHNYYFLKDAVTLSKNLAGAVLVNELSKVLSSTECVFDDQFILYAEQLGNIKGFDIVRDSLLFEEEPTLPLRHGLKVCYLLSEKSIAAPWTIYGQYFGDNERIKHEDLYLYLRFLFADKNVSRLIAITKRVQIDENRENFVEIFSDELAKYPDRDFIEEIEQLPEIKELFTVTHREPLVVLGLKDLITKLISIDSLYNNYDLLQSFFDQVEMQKPSGKELEDLIESLSNINWFYNWIIYCLKIRLLVNNEPQFSEVLNAFQYLIADTEPFKGKPRSSDLYSIQQTIIESLEAGLKLVAEPDQWKTIVGVVVKASAETSVSIQKDQGGPIPTYLLFKLLTTVVNHTNREIIIAALEEITENRKYYDLHSYISEYLFRLSNLYFQAGNRGKAEERFIEAIKTFTGYTQRRDQTIDDLLESLTAFSTVNYDKAIQYIPQIKTLIDSVDSHTDGKDTRHFFTVWFKKFSEISWLASANYLLNDLKNYRSYWRLEECLWNLLIRANGKVNVELELLLTTTFPIETSEDFASYCLRLIDAILDQNPGLAYYGFVCLSERLSKRTENGYSVTLIENYYRLAELFSNNLGFEKVRISKRKQYDSPNQWITTLEESYPERIELSAMSHSQLLEYVKNDRIRTAEIQSFVYFIDSMTDFNCEMKELIREIVKKNNYYQSESRDLSEIFYRDVRAQVYYWVCRYIFERDGWYNQLVNIEAFGKASSLDADLAKEYLFELLKDIMSISFRIGMSGNLVNALVSSKADSETITSMYDEMFQAISFRLPYQEKENWEDYVDDPFNMSNEEVLFAILFARLRSFSAERYQPTITAIKYLSKNNWDKLISPLKWFFKNKEFYLDCVVVSVVQLIFDFYLQNEVDIQPLAESLNEIYPTDYYQLDTMIEIMLEKPERTFSGTTSLLIYPAIDEGDYAFLSGLSKAVSRVGNMGLPVEDVLSKYVATYADTKTESLEIYGNRMYKQMAKNLYPSDYLLGLINRDLYTSLKSFYDQDSVIFALEIDNSLIQLQTQSRNNRPGFLPKPTSFSYGHTLSECYNKEDWVCIAHYEREFFSLEAFALKETVTFGGLVFTNRPKFPLSHHVIAYDPIETIVHFPALKSDYPIISNIREYDPFENLKLLWLPDWLVEELGLVIDDGSFGLIATDSAGKTALRYYSWKSDYVGSELRSELRDEIPKLDGAALLIEKSFYNALVAIYGKKPYYAIYRKG